MLFNSYVFIFGFLPICLFGFYSFARFNRQSAKIFLMLASFVFYGWWNVRYVPLLAGSIVFNYLVGGRIQTAFAKGYAGRMKAWCAFGVTTDLALLGYFKYTNFLVDNIDFVLGTNFTLSHIILPLGISFFTFQKIAYLIDSARGQIKQSGLLGFTLFAVFFPQLISGPIVRYDEVYPQFETNQFITTAKRNLMVGLVIFAIGLFKKTVIADTAGEVARPLYDAAASAGVVFDFSSGWIAAWSDTLQIYFDFSGYSDMAIGLARMFGIVLPLNFHSPLRAANIIDYWRRWHMTLNRFMVSYFFQPLSLILTRHAIGAGMRRWPTFALSAALPAFLTFVIIGLWHGAGWTFILYGVIHAVYVCANEVWREYQQHRRRKLKLPARGLRRPLFFEVLCVALTVLCVVASNVMFRADRVQTAGVIYKGMFGMNDATGKLITGAFSVEALMFMFAASVVVAVMPNTQQIMTSYRPAINWRQWRDVAPSLVKFRWRPNAVGIIAAGVALFLGLALIQRGEVVFLYFNF